MEGSCSSGFFSLVARFSVQRRNNNNDDYVVIVIQDASMLDPRWSAKRTRARRESNRIESRMKRSLLTSVFNYHAKAVTGGAGLSYSRAA